MCPARNASHSRSIVETNRALGDLDCIQKLLGFRLHGFIDRLNVSHAARMADQG
jgi:hypothetical protein